jgi:hypothetical protein
MQGSEVVCCVVSLWFLDRTTSVTLGLLCCPLGLIGIVVKIKI